MCDGVLDVLKRIFLLSCEAPEGNFVTTEQRSHAVAVALTPKPADTLLNRPVLLKPETALSSSVGATVLL